MIITDQPNCFPPELRVAVSSRQDGTMLDRSLAVHHPGIVANRRAFCQRIGVDYQDVVYQRVVYTDRRSYDCLAEVDEGATTKYASEIVADGLITYSQRVMLLLPVADCVATVLYDPVRRVVALLHLGRHSTVAGLMQKALQQLVAAGSRPADMIVWMSPSAQNYRLDYFVPADHPAWRPFVTTQSDGIYVDLQGFNAQVCRVADVPEQQIHQSTIDTMTNSAYFSHRSGGHTGRFAVVAGLVGTTE